MRLTDLGKRLTRQAQDWRGALQKDLATTSWEQRILLVAVPTLLILAPWILGSNRLITVANTAGINAIALYGLALLYGQLGYLSLAHAALIGVGAYTGGILMDHIIFEGGAPVPEPFPNTDWATWAVIPLAAITAAIAAGLLGFASRRVSGYHFVILTFAFGALLPIVLKNWWISGRNEGILLRDPPTPPGLIELRRATGFLLPGSSPSCFLAMIVYYLIVRSSFGRTLRGIRENETLAGAVGINTASYKIAIFAISGAFAGVAGVLFIHHFKSVNPPQFGGIEGVFFALMLLLGGPRWLLGPPRRSSLDPIPSRNHGGNRPWDQPPPASRGVRGTPHRGDPLSAGWPGAGSRSRLHAPQARHTQPGRLSRHPPLARHRRRFDAAAGVADQQPAPSSAGESRHMSHCNGPSFGICNVSVTRKPLRS